MSRKYLFRKNCKSIFEDERESVLGRLAFKTKDSIWVGYSDPVVALVSVHSAFHEGVDGYLKMSAFLSAIRSSVKGKTVALIADTAHLKARSLLEGQNAQENCIQAAKALVDRYQPFFDGWEVLYWHALCQGDTYLQILSQIKTLAEKEDLFAALLLQDAQSSYTDERKKLLPNEGQFIEETRIDLIEQCACLHLLDHLGVRYLFYPGASYLSARWQALNLQWIDVFLSIEKKTKTPILQVVSV